LYDVRLTYAKVTYAYRKVYVGLRFKKKTMQYRTYAPTIYSSLFTLMVETIEQYNRKYKKKKKQLN